MRTRVIGVVLVLVVGLLLLPTASQAASSTLKLAPNVGPPTTKVKAKGSHYPGKDAVTITLDGTTVASATTSAAGAFSASFIVPATALPGPHTVAAFDPAGLGAFRWLLLASPGLPAPAWMRRAAAAP